MRNFTVSVKKLTDENLLREACESTFLGKSKASLLDLYKAEHSPVRTQMFWIQMQNIPLASSTHLLRHHVGSVPFQLTCRDDRHGGNPNVPQRCKKIVEDLKSAYVCIDQEDKNSAHNIIASSIEEVEWLEKNSDRQTPVNLSLFLNAQSLIDMSKLRICMQAHEETRIIFNKIKSEIAKIDSDLASMMVRKCVYRNGLCGEMRCCGFNNTPAFVKEWKEYSSKFNEKQLGILAHNFKC